MNDLNSIPPAILIIGFVTLWLVVLYFVSQLLGLYSGWFEIYEKYGSGYAIVGEIFRFSSCKMGKSFWKGASFGNVLFSK